MNSTRWTLNGAKNWDRLILVREEVLKALEPLRAAKTISSALEARVTLGSQREFARGFAKKRRILAWPVYRVSGGSGGRKNRRRLHRPPSMDGLQIKIDRALGTKCERCWNYSTHVGESADYPTVCERCVAALSEIERERPRRRGVCGLMAAEVRPGRR